MIARKPHVDSRCQGIATSRPDGGRARAAELGTGHIVQAADAHAVIPVRTKWLDSCADECRAFINQSIYLLDQHELRHAVRRLVTRLPDPRNRAEETLLTGLVLEICATLGRLLHDRAHAQRFEPCRFVPCHLLDSLWQRPDWPAKRLVVQWADAFASAFAETHPPSPAEQAALRMRLHCATAWRLSELTEGTDATLSHLRRAFLSEYGMGMTEYLRRVRVLRALERMIAPPVCITTLANEVGYRSKKNFYRALRAFTTLTPAQFLRLPLNRKRHVTALLKRSLIRDLGTRTQDWT